MERHDLLLNYNHLNIQTCRLGAEWGRSSPREILQYAVGALLYTPGSHAEMADAVCTVRYPQLKSLVFCLEDSVPDDRVEQAEQQLCDTLFHIARSVESGGVCLEDLPLLFVRVRSASQLRMLAKRLGTAFALVTGFIFPKFDSASGMAFLEALQDLQAGRREPLYGMPILESALIMRIESRAAELLWVRSALAGVADNVLNVRVGGNDFCGLYGLRRDRTSTVYDIAIVRDALAEIMNVLGTDYVVSAPVWEYFGGWDDVSWQTGLLAELALDKLNGFVGKTAIHPSQLEIIQSSYVVSEEDYLDAVSIMDWEHADTGVAKSIYSLRMNEVKVHQRWAQRVLSLAHIYGVKERAHDKHSGFVSYRQHDWARAAGEQ